MKIFFVTFQCQARIPDSLRSVLSHVDEDALPTYTTITHRMFMGCIGNRYTWVQLDRNWGNPFTVPVHNNTHDMVADRCERPIADIFDSPEEAALYIATGKFCDATNVHVTEVTAAQRAWLWRGDGKYIGYRLCYPFRYVYATSANSAGRRRAIDYILEHFEYDSNNSWRFGSGSPQQVLTYHGRTLYVANYKKQRNALQELGAKVRDAIRDSDVSDLQSHIIDYCGTSWLSWSDTLSEINESLDKHGLELGITLCDCGHFEYDENTQGVGRRGDTTWCDSCFQEDAVYCNDRDEYWPRDDCYEHDGGEYYSYEQEHDEYEDEDDEEPSNLMSYSTNVLKHVEPDHSIKSSPTGNFLMGIEFELITEGRVSSAVDDVRSQLGESYCVCKSDGSLAAGGLEIVTAPRGLVEHIERFKKWNVHSDYRAWDKKCCGMHIHIDSRAFTEMTLGKFLMLINSDTNVDFIRKIAGRHAERDEQARTYCASERQSTLVNPKQAIKGKSSERYRMVNLQNLRTGAECKRLGFDEYQYDGKYNTVELRIFRASLKKERLLAQIEFTHAAVMFCRVASWRELNQVTFLKFLRSSSSLYPNLADWYGVRRRAQPCLTGKQTTCQDQPETV